MDKKCWCRTQLTIENSQDGSTVVNSSASEQMINQAKLRRIVVQQSKNGIDPMVTVSWFFDRESWCYYLS